MLSKILHLLQPSTKTISYKCMQELSCYIIVCFLQLQTRKNIKSDLMFGTILDSELTNLRELIWHGIKHGIG